MLTSLLTQPLGRLRRSQVWQAGRQGFYDGLHYEIAALSLGDVLKSEKNYAEAVLTYEQVNEASQPDPEVLQKANLAAGEMYDLLAKRDLAVKRYQAVVAVNSTTTLAENANRYLKEPYRGE